MSNEKQKSVAELLAEGKTPVAPAVATPAAPAVSSVVSAPDTLSLLLQILLQKEAREAVKLQAEENAAKQRQIQRAKNAKELDAKYLLKQARCKHIKGGKNPNKVGLKDYAVFRHSFISGTTYIKCMLCSAKWYPEDTAEFLMRKGKRISNHTKIGWAEAIAMENSSTNKASSSEIPPNSFGKLLQTNQPETKFSVPVDEHGQPVDSLEI